MNFGQIAGETRETPVPTGGLGGGWVGKYRARETKTGSASPGCPMGLAKHPVPMGTRGYRKPPGTADTRRSAAHPENNRRGDPQGSRGTLVVARGYPERKADGRSWVSRTQAPMVARGFSERKAPWTPVRTATRPAGLE